MHAWLEPGGPLDCAFQSLNEVIVVFDDTAHFRYCNERFTQEVGYTCEEVMGRPAGSMMTTDEYRQLSIQKLAEALQGKDTVYRAPVRNRAGAELWAEIRASALRGPNHEIIGVVAACSNITREQQARVKLEETVRTGEGEVEALIGRLEKEIEERQSAERVALSQKKVLCDALERARGQPRPRLLLRGAVEVDQRGHSISFGGTLDSR